jgi:hypothetical protein
MPTGRKASAPAGAAPRKRSGLDLESARSTEIVTFRVPRGTKAHWAAIAEAEELSLSAWLTEAAEWHERRAALPDAGSDDLDAGNPLEG